MAHVRLMLLGVLAACETAGAAPPSGIAAPKGWRAMPDLATAAKDGLGKSVVVDGAEGWGEPAMGCYGVWMDVRASGETVADRIVEGFAAAKLVVREVAKPAAVPGVLALAFERAPYKGNLRVKLGNEHAVALACFWNQREPAACEATCKKLLEAIP